MAPHNGARRREPGGWGAPTGGGGRPSRSQPTRNTTHHGAEQRGRHHGARVRGEFRGGNGGRARCPHRAANPHEMTKAPQARRGRGRPTRTGGAHGHGAATGHERCARPRGDAARWGHRALPPCRTGGAHGHGTMRRDRDIAPYRQATRVVRTATGRSGAASARESKPHGRCARDGAATECGAASREARRPIIAPYRHAARAVRTRHGACIGARRRGA